MAITTSPTYPVAGELVTLTDAGAGADETVLFKLTSVPSLSSLSTGVLTDQLGNFVSTFTPDVGGAYAFTTLRHKPYVGYWGDFAEDPGGRGESIIAGRTSSQNVYVGQFLSFPLIHTDGHQAELRLGVWNGTVQSASIVNPTTELARLAALDATVAAAVATAETRTPAQLGDELATQAREFRTAFVTHMANATAHNAADTANALAFGPPYSNDDAVPAVEDMAAKFIGHLSETATTWHDNPDTEYGLRTPPASTIAGAYLRLADLISQYERHRVKIATPAVHDSADSTNTVSGLILTTIIAAWLDYVSDATPTAIATENSGSTSLQGRFGARATT